MATTYLFANNATTTLASPITDTDTQATVVDAADFPTPGADEIFTLTFVDAATGTINEICHCTGRTGNVLNIVRAQEGTTALAWAAGSTVANFNTAGTQRAFLQAGPGQETPQFWTAGGTADALTITPVPAYATYFTGMLVRVQIAAPNTGAATLNVNGLGAKDIRDQGNVALVAGALVAGRIMEFAYNGTNFRQTANQPVSSFIDNLAAAASLNSSNKVAVDQGSGAVETTLGALAALVTAAQQAEIEFWGMMR